MRIRFTKMQGAGNDFVVLDESRQPLGLKAAQYRLLADRHRGIGADQILSVRAAPSPEVDFAYAIHNADGGEVEHCGNGARCFMQFVHEHGLSKKEVLRVQTLNRVLELKRDAKGRVIVDMGKPVFELDAIPFDATDLTPMASGQWQAWPLELPGMAQAAPVAVLSMGNPHAVLIVNNVTTTPVETLGPLIEGHRRFPRRVNAGFMQIVDRGRIRLRVYERGAGETLSCGTGACAAVVAGRKLGLLDARVDVATGGGLLTVKWDGDGHRVRMTGPATTVFEGEIELPAAP